MERLFNFLAANYDEVESLDIGIGLLNENYFIDIELNGISFSYNKKTKIFYRVECPYKHVGNDLKRVSDKRFEKEYGKPNFKDKDFGCSRDWWFYQVEEEKLEEFFDSQLHWREYSDF